MARWTASFTSHRSALVLVVFRRDAVVSATAPNCSVRFDGQININHGGAVAHGPPYPYPCRPWRPAVGPVGSNRGWLYLSHRHVHQEFIGRESSLLFRSGLFDGKCDLPVNSQLRPADRRPL